MATYLEHIVLWWAPSPMALRVPHSSQHLRDWILKFIPKGKVLRTVKIFCNNAFIESFFFIFAIIAADISPVISSALTSLADALGAHVTSTSWDKNFRLGMVACIKKNILITGPLMEETLEDLVNLCNQYEATADWIVGAPLEELPIVEQIPVLHRLGEFVEFYIR